MGGAEPWGIFLDGVKYIYASDIKNSEIKKFTLEGELVSTWTAGGFGEGKFYNPNGMVVDAEGNLVVCDPGSNRIQKFTAEGRFIESWPIQSPVGIARHNNGDFYVASFANVISRLNSQGDLLGQWGSYGTDDGQFMTSYGIVVDNSGNVYVGDESNHNIQKFTSDGTFIKKWGSYGTGDGQFSGPNGPTGITVDHEGSVYACDPHNGRIQKFTSDGRFVLKWDNLAPSLGQSFVPYGIAVDSRGFLYVGDLDHRIIQLSPTGDIVGQWGSLGTAPEQMHSPIFLALDENESKIYVVDSIYNRIQIFKKVNLATKGKAIIVSGGGPYEGNNLWDATQMCANFAYRTLTYQGFTKGTIHYLSSDTDLDLDSNGVADDVDGDATNSNLQKAITTWAKDADSLVIYLVDHGGNNTFRMSGTETFSAVDLDGWLDTLQETVSGKVTVIYDACESGTFLSSLTPPSGKERIVVASTSPGESAKFVTQGSISFFQLFLDPHL